MEAPGLYAEVYEIGRRVRRWIADEESRRARSPLRFRPGRTARRYPMPSTLAFRSTNAAASPHSFNAGARGALGNRRLRGGLDGRAYCVFSARTARSCGAGECAGIHGGGCRRAADARAGRGASTSCTAATRTIPRRRGPRNWSVTAPAAGRAAPAAGAATLVLCARSRAYRGAARRHAAERSALRTRSVLALFDCCG